MKSKNNIILLGVLAVIILVFSVYWPTVNASFMRDDEYLVQNNIFIRGWNYIPEILLNHSGAGSGHPLSSYRPMRALTFMANYAFSGLDVRPYHLFNISLHILVTIAVFWLIFTLFKDKYLAGLTALLFVLHPIHTESVSYISGRSDPLAALFLLLSFTYYIKYSRDNRARFYILSLLCFSGALISKEMSIILPLLFLCYHLVFKVRFRLAAFIPFILIIAVFAIRRSTLINPVFPHKLATDTCLQRIPGFLAALMSYTRLMILPIDLHTRYGYKIFNWLDIRVVSGLIVLAASLALAFKLRRTNRLLAFSILWFFTGLLPVSNIYPMSDYMKEHFLYFPSIGFFLVLAGIIRDVYVRYRFKTVAATFFIALLSIYSFITFQQNLAYWTDPITFYERTLRLAPKDPSTMNNLAVWYDRSGKQKAAMDLLKDGVAYNPNDKILLYNLALHYSLEGNEEGAVSLYKRVLARDPDYYEAWNNLGNAYRRTMDTSEAIICYMNALILKPDDSLSYKNLGALYYDMGKIDMAIGSYTHALKYEPASVIVLNDLGLIYKNLRKWTQAISFFKNAIEINPAYAPAYFNLADVYSKKKEYNVAVSFYNKGKSLGMRSKRLQQELKPYLKDM